jgi:formylglycine-generating enzyme required for sulfatase activity
MRLSALSLFIVLVLACVSLMLLGAADEELVAVMDLVPQGARPEEALAITNQLRTQLLKTRRFTLVDRSQIDAILKEQALQQTGCTSDECAVQVGKLLGVRKIISGSVTKLSDQLWQISVLLLDVETGTTLRAESETYEGNLIIVIRNGVPDMASRLAGVSAPPERQVATPAPRAAITPPQPEQDLVAVMDLLPQGLQSDEALAVTAELWTQLFNTGKFALLDRGKLAAILSEATLQPGDCTSDECLVQVGKLLGVRKIVSGSVTKLSDEAWQISVRMLDVETAKTLRLETEAYEGSLVTVIRSGIPGLAARLAGTQPAQTPAPAETAAPQPAAVWRDPVTGIEFVAIPGGEYEQGCGPWTRACFGNENPTRRIRLSPFWLAATEVTQGQWKTVMGSNPAKSQNGDNYPVEQVSWKDVQEFIQRLNSENGETFRLPSEAEWEYACRAGGQPAKYGTQSGELSRQTANYGTERCCSGDSSDGYVNLAPVGSFPANRLGLFDMTGNVWEWVLDNYSGRTYRLGAASDPVYKGIGNRRVIRGGGWVSNARYSRCSMRERNIPSYRSATVGFRLARTQ